MVKGYVTGIGFKVRVGLITCFFLMVVMMKYSRRSERKEHSNQQYSGGQPLFQEFNNPFMLGVHKLYGKLYGHLGNFQQVFKHLHPIRIVLYF